MKVGERVYIKRSVLGRDLRWPARVESSRGKGKGKIKVMMFGSREIASISTKSVTTWQHETKSFQGTKQVEDKTLSRALWEANNNPGVEPLKAFRCCPDYDSGPRGCCVTSISIELAVEEAAATARYFVGDLVWSLEPGFPPWPGRIENFDHCGNYNVFGYGYHSVIEMRKEALLAWTDANQKRFFVSRPNVPYFNNALYEVVHDCGVNVSDPWPHVDKDPFIVQKQSAEFESITTPHAHRATQTQANESETPQNFMQTSTTINDMISESNAMIKSLKDDFMDIKLRETIASKRLERLNELSGMKVQLEDSAKRLAESLRTDWASQQGVCVSTINDRKSEIQKLQCELQVLAIRLMNGSIAQIDLHRISCRVKNNVEVVNRMTANKLQYVNSVLQKSVADVVALK